MSKAELKANGIYNKYYSESLEFYQGWELGPRKEHVIRCALIHVKDTLELLSSLRATKQILKKYRLYTEVKLKIEGIEKN